MSFPVLQKSAARRGGGLGAQLPALSAGVTALYDWDFSRDVTVGNVGVIECVDQIAGRSLIQDVEAREPALLDNQFNGKPGVKFDGVDDQLFDLTIPTTATPYSCLMIYRNWEIPGATPSSAWAADGGSVGLAKASDNEPNTNHGGGGSVLDPAQSESDAHAYLAAMPANAGTLSWLDGDQGTIPAAQNASLQVSLHLGSALIPPVQPADITVARFIWFTGALTDADVATLTEWAQLNYGTYKLGPALPTVSATPLYDWDFSRGVTETGQGISACVDQVAGRSLLQSTDAWRPPLAANAFNGLPAADFNDDLAQLADPTIPLSGTDISSLLIYSGLSPNGTGSQHLYTNKAAAFGAGRVYMKDTGELQSDSGGGNASMPLVGSGSHAVVSAFSGIVNTAAWLDGAPGEVTAGLGNAVLEAPLAVGSATEPPLLGANCLIARVVFFTGTLTAADAAILTSWAVENYGTEVVPLGPPVPAGIAASVIHDWDASRGVSLGTQGVDGWTDQVGGRVLAATATENEPLLAPSQFKGLPGVDGRSALAFLEDATFPTLIAPLSIVYIVSDWEIPDGNAFLLSFANFDALSLMDPTGEVITAARNNTGDHGVLTDRQGHVMVASVPIQPNGIDQWLDGVVGTTSASTDRDWAAPFSMFNWDPPPGNPASAVMGRLLIFSGELTPEEVGIIAEWAHENYGTPLPSPELPTLTVTPLYDWDMADASVDSHALVEEVIDKVSGESLAQAVVSQRPRLMQDQFLGRPGADFDVAPLAKLVNADLPLTALPYSSMMVYRNWAAPVSPQFFSEGYITGSSVLTGKTTSGTVNFIAGAAPSINLGPEADETAAHIHMAGASLAATIAQLDGGAPVTHAAADRDLAGSMTVGGARGEDPNFAGIMTLARIVFFTGELTAQDMADLVAWAQLHYGTV